MIVARADGTVAVFEGADRPLPSSPTFTGGAQRGQRRVSPGGGRRQRETGSATWWWRRSTVIPHWLSTSSLRPNRRRWRPPPTRFSRSTCAMCRSPSERRRPRRPPLTQTASTKTEVVLATQDTGALTDNRHVRYRRAGERPPRINGDGLADFTLDGTMTSIPGYLRARRSHIRPHRRGSALASARSPSAPSDAGLRTPPPTSSLSPTPTKSRGRSPTALVDSALFSATGARLPTRVVRRNNEGTCGPRDLRHGRTRPHLTSNRRAVPAPACSFPGQASPLPRARPRIGDLTGDATPSRRGRLAGASGGAWL